MTELDAILWTGENIVEVFAFMYPTKPIYANDLSHMNFTNADDLIAIQTDTGLAVAFKGDWITRDDMGDLDVRKKDVPVEACAAKVRAEAAAQGPAPFDLLTIRSALEKLPATCRYHGERIEPEGSSWVSLRESCCDTGLPSVLRRRAMDVLDRIEAAR
ncbi:hypothetical protein [Streptacidiphilus sp. PAMC 29251]